MLALLVEESVLMGPFRSLGYWAPFLFLLGAGAGLPVPEEVTMTGSGYLVFAGKVDFLLVTLTCWSATLLGDSIPYTVGRVFGRRALSVGWVARLLYEERMAGLEERMQRHGARAILTIRFLPGLRLPGFFTAGVLKMPYRRFIGVDALAACVMVPFYVFLGKAFGTSIATLERTVADYTEWLGFALLIALASFAVKSWIGRQDRLAGAAKRADGADGGPENGR